MPAAATVHASELEVRFPPLPSTVGDVARLLQTGKQDMGRLSELLETDPIMAAAVLRRVNSAYFGMKKKVSDPRKGVTLLGFRDVCNLVMTTAFVRLEQIVEDRSSRRVFGDLVQVSLGAALFGDLIAEKARLPLRDAAFSCGLLHACGRLVMLQNYGSEYASMCSPGSDNPFPPAPLEQHRFGIDHMHLGSLALAHWNMPEAVGSVIGHLYAPGRLREEGLRTLALALSVAVSATEHLCLQPDAPPFRSRAALHLVARAGGIPSEQLRESIVEAAPDIQERMTRLGYEIGLA